MKLRILGGAFLGLVLLLPLVAYALRPSTQPPAPRSAAEIIGLPAHPSQQAQTLPTL